MFEKYLECVNCGHIGMEEDFEVDYPGENPNGYTYHLCPMCQDEESTVEITEEEFRKIITED